MKFLVPFLYYQMQNLKLNLHIHESNIVRCYVQNILENLATKGEWRIIKPRFKNLPVHIALLHTGKVLGFGGSGNDEKKLQNGIHLRYTNQIIQVKQKEKPTRFQMIQ